MHIKLEVLASTNIKRKKPWPRLGWLGREKESLFLMDNRRLSILYVPSGKTKKKIPKVNPHLENVAVSSSSSDGHFLVGLQHSGNLFLWHRDKDVVRIITGLPDLATHVTVKDKDLKEPDVPKPLVFVSNGGDKILVVIGHSRLFLWEADQPSSILGGLLLKQSELRGTWCHISAERDVILPTAHTKETSIDAKFFMDSVLGDSCICSYVFNVGSKLNITSILLRWLEKSDVKTKHRETFTVEWNNVQVPLTELVQGCRPIFSRGVYASSHSHDGLTLAVAANQRSPHDNKILFASLLTSTVQVSDLKGCGTKVANPPPKLARTYWIADMKWTADNLFLVCITKMGSVVILTRLGEPLRIESRGCSVELGPEYFLVFHPLITISAKKDKGAEIEARQLEQHSPTSSMMSDAGDIMKQRFSISTHPTLPMFLCSDGYMVTVMQLPDDTSCAGLMKTLLAEVRLKLNRVSELNDLPSAGIPTLKLDPSLDSLQEVRERMRYQFESPHGTMGMSTGSSLSPTEFLGINQMDEGKLYFAVDGDQMNQTGGSSTQERSREGDASGKILHSAEISLLSAWSLGVSYSEMWTKQLDTIMTITVDSMVKVCEMMLKTDSGSRKGGEPVPPLQSPLLERVFKLMTTSPQLYRILLMFQQAMSVMRWDTIHQHASTYAFRLILGTVQALLQSDTTSQPYANILTCCYHLLLFSEVSVNGTYTWISKAVCVDSLAEEIEFHLADDIESTILCRGTKRKRSPTRDPDEFDLDEQLSARSQRGSISAKSLRESLQELRMGMDIEKIEAENTVPVKHTPAKRLMLSWKMLYRQLLQYFTRLEHRLAKASAAGSDSLDTPLMAKKQRMVLLLCATQLKLRDLGFDVTEDKTWKSNANRMFLKGAMYYEASNFAKAIDTWREVALGPPDLPAEKVNPVLETHSLLAVLYTQLQQYNLMGALQLVDSLIDCYTEVADTAEQKSQQKSLRLGRSDASFMAVFTNMLGAQETVPSLPCVNSDNVRPVVKSLARFMALYFSNKPIYIYPPHSPIPLPSLLRKDITHACRVIGLYHEAVSYSIRQQDLSEIWTSDRALQLLLVAGLLPEAIWFAKELGDWKSAFVLGVTYIKYRQISIWKDQENGLISEELPEELYPTNIIQSGLEYLIQTTLPGIAWKQDNLKSAGGGLLRPPSPVALKKSPSMTSLASMGSFNVDEDSNIEQLSKTVTDMLTAAVISELDITPWLLRKLTDRCQSLVSELQGLVPEGLYLPAPPLYCPQPATASTTEETEDVVEERQSRHDIANTIQLLLLVLNASNCTLACTKWYVEQLIRLQETENAAQRDRDVSLLVDVPHTLAAHSKYEVDLLHATRGSQATDESIAQTLGCFRDLCSLTWLLHVRDKFCTCARKYQASREKSTLYIPHDTLEFGETLDLLVETLKWALCLLPFTQYLDMEAELQDMALTLISELPATRNTASILAEHFYHPDVISPAVEEKYQRLVEVMKTTHIASPRSPSTSVEDEKQSRKGKRKLPPQPEPLLHYFQQRCEEKQRDVASMNQKYGKMESQIFVGKSRTSQGLPVVGSREFERSDLFLEFLDTFFLVSFNKQTSAQVNTADLKHHLPLLLPYSGDIREQELTSVSHKVMKSFHQRHGISSQSPVLSRSQSYQEISPRTKQDFIEIRKPKDQQEARSPSPKRLTGGLFRSRSYSESLVQKSKPVLQVVHKRYGSHGSINPDKVRKRLYSGESSKVSDFPIRRHTSSESLPTDITTSARRDTLRHRSSSLTDVASGGGTGSDVFAHVGLSHGFSPYANINVSLDPKYDGVSQLMEWLTRWSGKHHIVMPPRKQNGPAALADSGIGVMRVHLPLQLVHNCLWLNDNKYLPAAGSSDARKLAPAILEEDTDMTASPEDAAARAKAAAKPEPKPRKKSDKKKDKAKKKKKKKAKTDQKHVEIAETAHVIGEHRKGRIESQRARRHLEHSGDERMESPFTRSRSPAETDITEDITAVSPLPTAASPFTDRTDQVRRSITPDDALSRETPLFSEPLESHVEPMKLTFTSTSDKTGGDVQGTTAEEEFSTSSADELSVSSINDELNSVHSEPEPLLRTVERVEPSYRRRSNSTGSPSGDIRKMVRFELKKIMEAQQQNIMQLLDSSGTIELDSSSKDRPKRSGRSVREESGRSHSSRDASHSHVDVQVAPAQMNADTQTGQTLRMLGEEQPPDIRLYGPPSHSADVDRARDVPYVDGHPYYPESARAGPPHFVPGYDRFTPRDPMHSARSYHEPVLEHGMPLLRLPPEAQAHLRMPRAWSHFPQEAWVKQPLDAQSGKEFFSRPELRRFQDDVKSRQEMDQYAPDAIKGNIHGKKFFSVADESEQSHHRQHVEDREAALRAQIGRHGQAPGVQHEPPGGVPLLKLEPGHQVPSSLFGHYYKTREDGENAHLPQVDSKQAPPDPERRARQESNGFAFPLLHMESDSYKPFDGRGGNGYHGIPRLIPPELVIDYEQQKYQREFAKYRGIYKHNIKNANIREWHSRLAFGHPTNVPDKTRKEYYANADELGPVQLLHADIGPFEAEGDRNNVTRRRRRRQKEKIQKSPKTDESKTEPVPQQERQVTQKKEIRKEDEVSEDAIHGLGKEYVIPPGTYDSELQKKRDISIYPTSAEIHYTAISNKEAQPSDRAARQDVATSMDANGLDPSKSVRFMEPDGPPTAADAVSQYAEAATGLTENGQIIAPDIFFGLRFGKAKESQPSVADEPDQQPPSESGRAYINVVDIDASVLNSIPDKDEPPKRPAQRQSPRRSPGQTEPTIAELHYRALRDRDAEPTMSPLPETGPDGLTVSILDGGMQADSVHMLPRVRMSHAERDRAKHKMSEKLIEMNDQLNAIDTMAQNMEREFKDANLLLHTVDQMAEAIAPEEETRPKTYYTSKEGTPSPVPDAREMGDVDITARPAKRESEEEFTPEDSLEFKKGREGRAKMDAGAPNESTGLPSVRAHRTQADENLLHISGLSGVSDIIAEVIADDDVDTTELGITREQKEAAKQHVQDRYEDKLWEYTRLSNQELKGVFFPSAKRTGDGADEDPGTASVQPVRRSVEEREELKKWMAKKRTKHMDEYKKKLQDLREFERQPYHPPKDEDFKPSASLKEIKKAEEARNNLKRTREEENVGERVKEAVKLMGDILSDKPETHKEPAVSTARTQHGYSPAGTGLATGGAAAAARKDRAKERAELEKVKKARKLLYSEAARIADEHPQRPQRRAFDEHDRTIVHADEYLHVRDSYEKDRQRGVIPRSTYKIGDTRSLERHPERSGEIQRSTDTDSAAMATAYTKQLERQLTSDLDKTATLDRIPEGSENKENEPMEKRERLTEGEVYEYKPKPYTKLVKMQRPEVTRKLQTSPRNVKTYSERLADMKTTPTKRASDSLKAKQRLYGTKRIPGSQKTTQHVPARVVKTYTERLAEMKKQSEAETRHYRRRYRAARRQEQQRATAPINTATMPVETDRMSQLTARGMRSDATPRSGVSYTERLKELSNAGMYRGMEGVVSPTPAVGVHFKGRSKTPTSYVERLQQAPKGPPVKHKAAYVGPPRTILKSPLIRSQPPRTRPYASPYRPMTAEDILDEESEMSVESQWNVPDDIKRLLDRDDTTYTAASEYSGLSFSEMDYIDGQDYTSAVDIRQLEEIASIGSESIISDIDWNAIENMIADVK